MKKFASYLGILVLFSSSNCSNHTKTDAVLKANDSTTNNQIQQTPDPLEFLSISGAVVSKNLTGKTTPQGQPEFDGWLVEGYIQNSSSDTRFKNSVVSVAFLSKNREVIKTWEETHIKYYGPGTSKKFSIKVYPPEATDTMVISLQSAEMSE